MSVQPTYDVVVFNEDRTIEHKFTLKADRLKEFSPWYFSLCQESPSPTVIPLEKDLPVDAFKTAVIAMKFLESGKVKARVESLYAGRYYHIPELYSQAYYLLKEPKN